MLSHRVRLVPTAEQEQYFRRACGVARFAYNWALAQWQRQYAAGEKPSETALRRELNAIKHAQYPWMREVTKNAPQQAIKNLGRAYANFFDDLAKYRRGEIAWKRVRVPKFKKKAKLATPSGPITARTSTILTPCASSAKPSVCRSLAG